MKILGTTFCHRRPPNYHKSFLRYSRVFPRRNDPGTSIQTWNFIGILEKYVGQTLDILIFWFPSLAPQNSCGDSIHSKNQMVSVMREALKIERNLESSLMIIYGVLPFGLPDFPPFRLPETSRLEYHTYWNWNLSPVSNIKFVFEF